MEQQIVRGPILNPHPAGRVTFHPDGILASDETGRIRYAGPAGEFLSHTDTDTRTVLAARLAGRDPHPHIRHTTALIMPPMLDAHIHIPQWPIRGEFCKNVQSTGHGRLLEGLHRNVFPEESRHADPAYTARVVRQFHQDTLAQGVVGGFAYMTVHPAATRYALASLPPEWHVGLVLMNQNAPEYLRTDESTVRNDLTALAKEFGPRCIVTDRFAVAVSSDLRRGASAIAREHQLPTQTHLNEQRAEKDLVEKNLYPDAASYTDVYRRDGLLDSPCLCAHCIWMRTEEWHILRDHGAAVGHCPTSNALLGSGIMNLDAVKEHQIPWSLCTDVGAGPTTSLLAEMAWFLTVHHDRHTTSAEEALCAATIYPAQILKLDQRLGSFEEGKEFSYVEVQSFGPLHDTPEQVIRHNLLGLPAPSSPPLPLRERAGERGNSSNAVGPHAPTPDLTAILNQLHANGLDDCDAITTLEHRARRTTQRLEHRILQVTLKSTPVFSRNHVIK